jgi:ATP-dependent RNA helicase RhlE
MTFASLGLSPSLVRSVTELGYGEPTPVQREAIPAVLRGGDLWASARTGSGKTAAFVLPLLESFRLGTDAADRSSREPPPRRLHALVLVPTRELAAQVTDAVEKLGWHLTPPPKTVVAVGGLSINPQMMELRGGADILVATPGRLLDLCATNAVRLDAVRTLVLDEADRLLSRGFADELAKIVALLPRRRQNLLFSATFPPAVQRLAASLLVDPVAINVDAGTAPDASAITQRAIEVDAPKRTMLLRHLLEANDWSHVLVFVASRQGADHVTGKLARAGIGVAALHGDLSQGARTAALADFTARRVRVLVATDVAARGLDIAQLPAVVNYDLPRSPSDYVHRIGRTGRAGESGVALSFLTAESSAHFKLIERRHALALEREHIVGFEPTEAPISPRDPNGGVKGRRKSKKDKLREAAARGDSE